MGKRATKRKEACYTSPASTAKKPPKGTRVNTSRRTSSDFLFARPSLVSGVARLVDFGCAFDSYNISSTGKEADVRALISDWFSVGDDISQAIEDLKAEAEEPEVA